MVTGSPPGPSVMGPGGEGPFRRPRILVAESHRFSEAAARCLRSVGDLHLEDLDRAGLISTVGGYDVLWVRLRNRVDAEVLDAAPQLRVLATPTTGLDHVDVESAVARGVRVIALRGEVEFLDDVRATAEHTLGLTIALMRHIPAAAEHVREGGWDRDRFWGNEIYEKTIGIVGYGRLGRLVARSFRALGASVLATDPAVAPDAFEDGVDAVTLGELLQRSHIVSVHADLNDATRGLLGREQFDQMRPGAYLVNTARGAIIDETALLEALRSGRLAAAALDVLADEGGQPPSPLVEYAREQSNLLITPHIGGAAVESREKTETFLAGLVASALGGKSEQRA